jgi:predicted ester cyclase
MDIVEMKGNKLKVKTTFGDGASMKVALGLIEPPLPLPPSTTTTTIPNPQPTGLVPLQAQDKFQVRWNKHDLSSIAEMLHADAKILVSPLLDPVDRNAYIGWQELFFTAFPDISMSTTRCYGGKDWAVSEIMLKGTNSGSYIGHASTGKKIELRAGYLTRFDTKGLITSLKLFIDSMVIMKQLGFEPVKSPT